LPELCEGKYKGNALPEGKWQRTEHILFEKLLQGTQTPNKLNLENKSSSLE